ncbi:MULTISPECIES: thioredoxin [Aurantimicrobium]|jgi:thioredoxin 1|uniref:Thioredoxin n=1 Tax=Aurantimicrobium photophilum TaxID=1987356 RepID=A0A2Z3RZX9_9MICO|nr:MULTISPECIES: thioredoxin [Aurantimicrobium]AWR21546.1 Putative thioredoxin-2 [Aurantimicrobium photophilum]MDH6537493.1 thioredoxin 1 [Aurantimicrobium minutum]
MASVELTAENFDSTITGNEIVVVDFWADWCGPCKMFAPTFEAASEKDPEIVFGKVDTEAEQSLAAAAGIQSIPTLMVFREKILLFSQAGALPPAALDDLIAQVKGLDMEAVHAEIAKQQAEVAE